MKKLFAVILSVLMLLAFAACDNAGNATEPDPNDNTTQNVGGELADTVSDLAFIQNKGKLVVGITDYAPMDFKDENGNWTGFDAEFAKLFAQEIGVEAEFFVIADWGQKFYELETKNIDVIWNGMTISDDVLLNTSCSNPYVINAQVVVMKNDKVASYTDADSLKGLKIACELGSVAEDALEAIGITDYITVDNQEAALLEVKAGTCDACVVDITMAKAMTGEGTNYADLSQGISLTEEEYGVGFRKGSDITEKFNSFMAKLMADGTLDALAEKYELTLVK
ncbi:MAG: transporter substrate-binding domain-containing protein [Oscillospiraceae bacterium]|nr:transporter substrate-binding domain-containing protein [Oscillospiraceae bacterium]